MQISRKFIYWSILLAALVSSNATFAENIEDDEAISFRVRNINPRNKRILRLNTLVVFNKLDISDEVKETKKLDIYRFVLLKKQAKAIRISKRKARGRLESQRKSDSIGLDIILSRKARALFEEEGSLEIGQIRLRVNGVIKSKKIIIHAGENTLI